MNPVYAQAGDCGQEVGWDKSQHVVSLHKTSPHGLRHRTELQYMHHANLIRLP